MRRTKLLDILKILFPALMVVGAIGSFVVNLVDKGEHATSVQWLGAALLYTALMLRILQEAALN